MGILIRGNCKKIETKKKTTPSWGPALQGGGVRGDAKIKGVKREAEGK